MRLYRNSSEHLIELAFNLCERKRYIDLGQLILKHNLFCTQSLIRTTSGLTNSPLYARQKQFITDCDTMGRARDGKWDRSMYEPTARALERLLQQSEQPFGVRLSMPMMQRRHRLKTAIVELRCCSGGRQGFRWESVNH